MKMLKIFFLSPPPYFIFRCSKKNFLFSHYYLVSFSEIILWLNTCHSLYFLINSLPFYYIFSSTVYKKMRWCDFCSLCAFTTHGGLTRTKWCYKISSHFFESFREKWKFSLVWLRMTRENIISREAKEDSQTGSKWLKENDNYHKAL